MKPKVPKINIDTAIKMGKFDDVLLATAQNNFRVGEENERERILKLIDELEERFGKLSPFEELKEELRKREKNKNGK